METNDTNTEITQWVAMRGSSAAGHPMYRSQAYAFDSFGNIEEALEAIRVAADRDVTVRVEDDERTIKDRLRNFGERLAPAAAPTVEAGVFEMVDEEGETVERRGITVTSRQNSISCTTRTVFWVEGRR